MKRNGVYILFFALIFLAFGCNKTETCSKDCFTLSGSVSNSQEQHLILTEIGKKGFSANDTLPLDKKGGFSKVINMQEETLYALFYGKDYITLNPKKGEKISITASGSDFSGAYTVSGSKGSEALKELNARNVATRMQLQAMSDYLNMNDIDNVDSVKAIFLTRLQDMYTEEQNFTKDFIDSHTGSLAALMALYRTFEGRPLFDYRNDLTIYKEVLEGLEKTLPQNQQTIILKKFIEQKEAERNERLAESKKK